jgi:tRNA(fMet)-specific endonuclease VapC
VYLLDTNCCSKILNNDNAVIEKLDALGQTSVSTCVIVRGELIYMAQNSERKEENLERFKSFLGNIEIYHIDEQTADVYGELKTGLMKFLGPKKKKQRSKIKFHDLGVDDNDLWIAAVAKQHGLVVVSGDKHFERINQADQNLKVENWGIETPQ